MAKQNQSETKAKQQQNNKKIQRNLEQFHRIFSNGMFILPLGEIYTASLFAIDFLVIIKLRRPVPKNYLLKNNKYKFFTS